MIFDVVVALEDDIRYLKGIKAAFTAPEETLESWVFDNSSIEGSICRFSRVDCWGIYENRLSGIQLRSSELTGQNPDSLQYCASLQTLDLSNNKVSGITLPQVCTWLPYLVYLDLSGNDISGEIPLNLVNCTCLNKLDLSNNRLSGQIPSFKSNLNVASFEGDNGLCGSPALGDCSDGSWDQPLTSQLLFYGGVTLGFIFGFWGLFFILLVKREKWWFLYWKLVDSVAVRITKPLLKY
ncbi:hypothetical protein MKX01_000817 [Papaver californicum]|nr:hypothetical protein MKX01_000817 [Papaver californicum]